MTREENAMRDNITNILVPVDFSPHAELALRYATTLARRLGAGVGLVHVVEDPFLTGAWISEIYVPNVPELLTDLIAGAERHLAVLKESAAAEGVTARTAVITGRPAEAIVEHAEAGGFDLIVMGTHGRTGLAHVMMGSVAERVVRKAPCPVLTVRATDAAETREQSAAA
jgi:nucleotide-binding universal stress UspA family protein